MVTCRTCHEAKPVTEFWKQASAKSGHQSECKDCMRKRNTAWGRANKPLIRDRNNRSINKGRRDNPLAYFFRSIKGRAKKNGVEFALKMEDLVIPDTCPVFGTKLSFGMGWGEGQGLAVRDCRASVDRIDNSRGYTRDNIVIVSYRANRIKSDATLDELKELVRFYEQLAERKTAARRVRSGEVSRKQTVHLSGVFTLEEKQA